MHSKFKLELEIGNPEKQNDNKQLFMQFPQSWETRCVQQILRHNTTHITMSQFNFTFQEPNDFRLRFKLRFFTNISNHWTVNKISQVLEY